VTNLIAVLLLGAGVLGAVVFVGLYSWRAPWWRTEVGWWLVTFPSSLGLLLANGLVFRIAGDYAGRQTVNLVLFAVVVASVWWCVALLHRATRRTRSRRSLVGRRSTKKEPNG
jgi:hypothetical protein